MVRFFNLISISVLISLSSQWAWSQESQCIQKDDLTQISENFVQFQSFIGEAQEYCAEELTEDWLKVLQSLVALKNSKALEPDFDPADALTLKAVSENDWWAYFVNRASTITIPASCPEGAAAYVMPMFMPGTIFLCRPFFEASKFSQASIMMHEVRHFDGHSHVTCTRGLDKGSRGACDPDILNKGSYAISVQTLVALARSPEIESADKLLLESEALFTAFNRFNTAPQVRMRDMMVLASDQGEVFEWELKKAEMRSIATLKEPAVVLNSYDNLTIYPLDPTVNAYRTDRMAINPIESIGLFANSYNAEAITEKEKYTSISYLGVGGLLKENSLITLCGNSTELLNQDLTEQGLFRSIISLSLDSSDLDRVSALVSDDGGIYSYQCDPTNDQKVILTQEAGIALSSELAQNLVESFGLGGSQYGVLNDGRLVELTLNNQVFESTDVVLPIENQKWVSATPMSLPELFNQ